MNSKEDNLIQTAIKEADELFLQLLKDRPIMDEADHRQSTFLLSLMTSCVTRLHILGWSEKDLCNEVFDWCETAREYMSEGDED